MNWKTALLVLFLIIYSDAYAEELDRHRFGFSLEGGASFTFLSGRAGNTKPWHDLYGSAGGTVFYNYRISNRFAIRPELGLYSYFFSIPGPGDIGNGTEATLNGRLGLTMIFYTYVGIDASFPLGLTTFISSRFYDSAGKYKSRLSEAENDVYEEILENDYISGGVQISFGVESTRSKPLGAGFSIFTRFADTFYTGGQSTMIIPTFGGFFVMFF